MTAGGWTALVCPTCGQANTARVDPALRGQCGRCGGSLGDAAPINQDLRVPQAPAEGPPPSNGRPVVTMPGGPPTTPRTEIAPPPARPYKHIGGVARAVMVLLAIGIAADLIAAISDVGYVGLMERIRDGGPVTIAEAQAADLRQVWIGLVQSGILLATIITFLVWFHRAYSNLGALGAARRHKLGWAIGGWFVPILWFFRPKAIANDIWRASDPVLGRDVGRGYEGAPVSPLINLWWAAFLISNWAGSRALRISLSEPQTADDLVSSARFTMYSDAGAAVAGALALVVVWAMTKRQEARAERYLFARPPT